MIKTKSSKIGQLPVKKPWMSLSAAMSVLFGGLPEKELANVPNVAFISEAFI
jgi:hypothetical protein